MSEQQSGQLAAHDVYLGLGANLAKPIAQIQHAITALQQLPQSTLLAVSSLYGSKPMGPQDQPDYVNAVAKISTRLAPLALLDALQQIELQQGRQRKAERWGPRSLDLDILLYASQTMVSERLTIPHYGLAQREFVLYPLAEIAPRLQLPCGTPLQALLSQVPLNGLQKLSETCSEQLAAAGTLCDLAHPE
ncbi:2-amino-4-hydroxy-6-hydroxymethyldihydropteridine pyrophosphokinase [Arsukibacterium ikkense]|uniref:2-amino-4-hydroxy-6-hydroxymethyldihydropteridine pyrophosphokinase n=1 Tax=Arsukibacterium ikkense TaxID=336831 RepID=A0A0M2V491_9GAMM|nr:2-amino-4-hydroxy-6-hydroxymethyldihydropteridine diphosphokinase [Arsukibacterium ikkense]KKO44460.1 2-amino-4-hydroxy-6-hydroxymethyldihydropteridine pyrophosphokinase [Arsukibacterium ikkense]